MKSFLALLFLTLTVIASAGGQDAKSARNLRSDEHLKLRMDYAASASYNPYASGLREIRRRSATLLEEKKFDDAI
jgi:hypothetical protein